MAKDRFMSVAAVSEELGVSVNTLRGWIRREIIPFTKTGGRILIERQRFEAWLAENSREPVETASK